MVGVGIEGSESSLARVSVVNYTGAIILDVFVRQREKVVDYRTQWSGVRSTDLAGSGACHEAQVPQSIADGPGVVARSQTVQRGPGNSSKPGQGPDTCWPCDIQ